MKGIILRVRLYRERETLLARRARPAPQSGCLQVDHSRHRPPPVRMSFLQFCLQGGGPRRKSELKIEIEGVPEGRTHVEVLCFDLVYFTKPAQFVILSAGVFFFYLLYGYYQELIFSLPGFTGYGWYLTLIQFGYYSIFGKVRRGTQ